MQPEGSTRMTVSVKMETQAGTPEWGARRGREKPQNYYSMCTACCSAKPDRQRRGVCLQGSPTQACPSPTPAQGEVEA